MRDLLVEGLTAPVTAAEHDAASRPPYPVPAAQVAPRDQVLRLLEAHLPDDGDGPLTVTRVRATPISYRSQVHQLGRPGRFDFADAACALVAVGALTDVEELMGFLPSYCGIRRQQVLNHLAADDLAEARAAAGRIEDGQWVACRDIGRWLADRGDPQEFFRDWKQYAAGRDRHGMTELRRLLVVGVAQKDGWRAALAVTGDKRIGAWFARFAFEAYPVGDIAGLRRVIAGVLSELDELSVLARAVRLASGHNPAEDHPLLGEIVDRIIAVDPTTDKATMRWRDAELFGLWPAYGEQTTLDRVRSAVRTPGYRRELKVLARDLDR